MDFTFYSFPVALGLYILPGIIIFFVVVSGVYWCLFICLYQGVCVYPQIVSNAGTMFHVFIKKQIPKEDFSFRLELPHCVIDF